MRTQHVNSYGRLRLRGLLPPHPERLSVLKSDASGFSLSRRNGSEGRHDVMHAAASLDPNELLLKKTSMFVSLFLSRVLELLICVHSVHYLV